MVNRRIALALAFAVFIGACSDANLTFARRVRQMTLPADATASDVSDAVNRGQSVAFTWEVDTRLSWNAYVDVLIARLAPPFQVGTRTAETVSFSEVVNGDAYRLDVVAVGGYSTTHARVTLTSSAD